MKVEFSKRFDGRYNVWRWETTYSAEQLKKAQDLGVPDRNMYYWNLVGTAGFHDEAISLMRKFKNAAS